MSWQCFANTSAVSARGLVWSDWSTLLRTTWRRFISPEVNTSTEAYSLTHKCYTDFLCAKFESLTSVSNSGGNQFVEQLVWDGGTIFVVTGHSSQRLLFPNPVLKHLRRHLHKVCLHHCSAEFWKSGLTHTQKNSFLFISTQYTNITNFLTEYSNLHLSRFRAWHDQTHENRSPLHGVGGEKDNLSWAWWSLPPWLQPVACAFHQGLRSQAGAQSNLRGHIFLPWWNVTVRLKSITQIKSSGQC